MGLFATPPQIPIARCCVCRSSRTLHGFTGGPYVCPPCLIEQIRALTERAESNRHGDGSG